MSRVFRSRALEALEPPAWQWARGAARLKREHGISLRAYRRARGARLDLLPPFVELAAGLVVDLGANAGDWTANVIAAVPSVRVLAVEPYPAAYARIARRFAGAAQVRVDKRAVSSGAGVASFHVAEQDVFGSLLEADPALEGFYGVGARTTDTITVPTVSLDELIGGEPVSLLKVDVQGAELQGGIVKCCGLAAMR